MIDMGKINQIILAVKASSSRLNPDEITKDKLHEMRVSAEKYIQAFDPTFEISSEENDYLDKYMQNIFPHKQEDAIKLFDPDNNGDWYLKIKDNLKNEYWNSYKNYLNIDKKFPTIAVNELENVTLNDLVPQLSNPKSEGPSHKKGLVIGSVQSGKTSTYIGLICKALDIGYKVVILLTGTIEDLRKQTQQRIDFGVIGLDSSQKGDHKKCGVGKYRSNIEGLIPLSLTSQVSDFSGALKETTSLALQKNSSRPVILVIKKNAKILDTIYKCLVEQNDFSHKTHEAIEAPLLLIDDEADNASVNTKEETDENDTPTRINGCIRKILNLFARTSYVGFTATPFANVFISPATKSDIYSEDLFPSDFIYSLPTSSNYIGPANLFSHLPNDTVNFIEDSQSVPYFNLKTKSDWTGRSLFPSFYDSICCFFIQNAIRDIRGDITTHRSMLINVSKYIAVQSHIKEKILLPYVEDLKNSLFAFSKMNPNEADGNSNIKRIHRVYYQLFDGKVRENETWENVLSHLYESTKDIKVEVVNNNTAKTRLKFDDYKETGLRVIMVGGMALSRGLTLEGLLTSYFYRSTSTFDVLMQMGRWFGYRPNYGDICRIWMLENSAEWYGDIEESICQLKEDMKKMFILKKKPVEFGIRVRNDSEDLGITASNKMRNTVVTYKSSDFYGDFRETRYLYESDIENNNNYDAFRKLYYKNYKNITNDRKKYNIQNYGRLLKNVDKADVLKFLEDFVVPSSSRFDCNDQIKFIESVKDLSKWDVYVCSGGKKDGTKFYIDDSNDFYLVERSFDVTSEKLIRLERNKTRIGSKGDTSYGLELKEIERIKNDISINYKGVAQKFLIEHRNPILVIYLVHLIYTPDINYPDDSDYFNPTIGKELEVKYSATGKPLVGFLIGYPSNSSNSEKKSLLYSWL